MVKKLIILISLLVLIISSCVPVNRHEIRLNGEIRDRYYINCYFDEVEKVLKGYQQITYYNKEEEILENIYFHLYPNAFQEKNTAPFLPDELTQAYPLGFDPGFIEVHNVDVDGRVYSWGYQDAAKNVLKISLDKPLQPGQALTIDMNYTLKFPLCHGRFGYGENTLRAANWYPVAAVFDDKGWNLDPYYPIGDPFYSDISDYHVRITLPDEYTVASTGQVRRAGKIGKGYREWMAEGKGVRDFAWIASKSYKVKKKKVKGTEIKSYFFDETGGEKALETAARAVEIFSELFGDYPYRTYSVAASDFFIGGMEYPNLVFIDKELYNKGGLFSLEYVVAHETAHQWWYGVVGNNEIAEAWLDEGLTEYSTVLYYYERYGPETGERILNSVIEKPYYSFRDSRQNNDTVILEDLKEYGSWQEYSSLVYAGGALIIDWLRKQLGDELFFRGLRKYYDTYKFQNATTGDFIEIMQDVAEKPIENEVMQRLKGDR